MAVRDTLKKHGIREGAVSAEGLIDLAAGKQRGLHVQLVLRDCEPTLLSYLVAMQTAVRERLARLDPLSAGWITGVSWRFEPAEGQPWPQFAPVPSRHGRKAPAAPEAQRGRRETLERMLAARDVPSTGGGTVADFSPTLPMDGTTG